MTDFERTVLKRLDTPQCALQIARGMGMPQQTGNVMRALSRLQDAGYVRWNGRVMFEGYATDEWSCTESGDAAVGKNQPRLFYEVNDDE